MGERVYNFTYPRREKIKKTKKKQVNGEEGKHQKRPESPKTTLMKRACGGPPFQTHTQY